MKKFIARFKDRSLRVAAITVAATAAAPSVAFAQATTPPSADFSPIIDAANWTTTVIPAVLAIAGAIAGVLVVVSGIKYVLGAIRRA